MREPKLLILNQMAGPVVWELAEDLGAALGPVALLTGHPDTLAKGSQETVHLYPAAFQIKREWRIRKSKLDELIEELEASGGDLAGDDTE